MKMKQFYLAALAALTLASCSKQNPSGSVDFEGQPTTATLTVSVGDSDPEVKAVTFPNSASSEAERKIYNLVAVAFDSRGLLEAFVEQDYFQSMGGVEASALSVTFESITTGAKDFYVIANAPTNLIARKNELYPKGMKLADFKLDIAKLGAVSDIIKEKAGYATGDLNAVTRGFLMTSEEGVAKTLTNDAPNTIAVKLVRVAAKVSVAYDPASDGEPQGVLKNVEYKVVNNPKETYIFSNVSGGQLYTPFFNSEYSSNNYLGAAHDYKPAIIDGMAEADKTHSYAIENSNMAELQGNSTMVLIKAQFVPHTWLDADGNPSGPTADGTFWRIRNASGIWDTDYYSEVPDNNDPSSDVVRYDEGVCYYRTWLKNASSSQHIVKRNTYVKLKITAVYSAGEGGEDDEYEPEKPINETTNAKIGITVKDWEEDNQSTTL